jgi:hypothetical protein
LESSSVAEVVEAGVGGQLSTPAIGHRLIQSLMENDVHHYGSWRGGPGVQLLAVGTRARTPG